MSYLNLLINVSNGDLVWSIFDRWDAFDFHIVNFPDLSGNVPMFSTSLWYIHLTTDKI